MVPNSLASSIPVIAVLLLSGCGTIRTAALLPDVVAARDTGSCTPTGGQKLLLTTGYEKEFTRASAADKAHATTLIRTLSMQRVLTRIDGVSDQLPPQLRNEKVVQQLLNAARASAYQTRMNVAKRAGLSMSLAEDARVASRSPVEDLDLWDFKSFAATVRDVMFAAPMSHGGQTGGSKVSSRTLIGDEVPFKTAFVEYYRAYYEGEYIDRFGNKLPKPAVSLTIGNTEIAATVQVLWDLILDYVFTTPVLKDAQNKYYPGDFTGPPTVVAVKLADIVPLLSKDDSEYCGITPLKAQAILYLSNAAGTRAASMGGLIGGNFGGIEIGLGVLGKISIGDNQTLQVLVKSTLSKAFERIAEDASYNVLYWIPYDKDSMLADLIQRYLEAQN